MSLKNTSRKSRTLTPDVEFRICFDRVVPAKYKPQPTASDLKWRAVMPWLTPWPKDHRILKCRFLDGDRQQRKKVETIAHVWEKYANVRFDFVKTGEEEIRISFTADEGSWSALGTDALVEEYFPKHLPTMNFGWLKADTEDKEYQRVVLHEFGHVLGLDHEHQNPNATLKWNKTEVKRVYAGPPNYWSMKDIESNILQKYSPEGVKATRYDPDSIMLYMFPASLFLNGEATKVNNTLSRGDKDFIRKAYP